MAIKIQEALQQAVAQIEQTKVQTPLLDAEVLLCHVLDLDRLYLYLQRNQELTYRQWEQYTAFVDKRVMGVPVQYIIHKQEFMGLDFYVEEGVLIPRPDTEILVETIIQWTQKNMHQQEGITIVDLGTGSGGITVSLAKYIPNAFVHSVDISPKALKIGMKNAESHGVKERTQFLQGDLFGPLEKAQMQNKVDILVSNPPYIPKDEIDKLQVEVAKYEPRLALDGGIDGLDFYRRIIDAGYIFLKNDGFIGLEVGHDQADAVKRLMEEKGTYKAIEKIKDLAGIERVVTGVVEK
ncbi:peptide chain release factor N(5)-glutamine methyltransferase [Clostridiaceae bacterium 35-E11]